MKKGDVIDVITSNHGRGIGGFILYDVCPIPFLTDEAGHFLEVYYACNGVRSRTPDDFYRLSALYVRAVKIIESELARIAREKKESE